MFFFVFWSNLYSLWWWWSAMTAANDLFEANQAAQSPYCDWVVLCLEDCLMWVSSRGLKVSRWPSQRLSQSAVPAEHIGLFWKDEKPAGLEAFFCVFFFGIKGVGWGEKPLNLQVALWGKPLWLIVWKGTEQTGVLDIRSSAFKRWTNKGMVHENISYWLWNI